MKQFFAPISKIDKKTREVHGILALEVKDKEGEIMDYADSKPLFEAWSKGIQKASGGKSVGNLREMHQPIVAGKFTSMVFNDELKQIEVISKVSNDSSWKKVLDGELNGYSIYGNPTYRKRDKVNKAIRYAVSPLEGSLVDNPCMYGADFTLIKEDGVEVMSKFAGEKKPYQFWSCRHECDLLHKTEVEASGCNGVTPQFDYLDDDDSISKSMYDVSSLASNISSLKYISVDDANRTKFATAIKSLFSVLSGMVKVEAANFQDSLDALDTAASAVKSVGMDILKGDKMKLKVKKSAGTTEVENDDDFEVEFDEKTLEATITKNVTKSVGLKIAKAIGPVIKEALDEALEDITEGMEALKDAVVKISGLPKKSKTVVKGSDKKRIAAEIDEEEEETDKPIKKTSDVGDPELRKIMKAALKNPTSMHHAPEEEEETTNEEEATETEEE